MQSDALNVAPGAAILVALGSDDVQSRVADELVRAGHTVSVAAFGEEGFRKLRSQDIELAVVSPALARPNAFQFCERLRTHPTTRGIPVLFVVGPGEEDLRERALDVGASDFIRTPLDTLELRLRVASLIRHKRVTEQAEAAERVIFGLAGLLKDKVGLATSESERLAAIALALGGAAGLPEEDLEVLRKGALLHDVGKLGVREKVLLKADRLSNEEYQEIQTHPELGERICLALDDPERLLPVIRHQQERWDGQGYPDGLAGEAIPLLARILSIAQAYDAMLSRRPHRPPLTIQEARSNLLRGAGAQWDPRLVELFLTRAADEVSAAA